MYNSVGTIGQALDSILEQSYPDIESVIVDGESSDGTLAILECYRPLVAFLVSEPDRGIYDALNKGIKYSTGDVIGFLHADDVFENCNVLSKIAIAFLNPAVDAVYGDLVYVRHDDISQIIRYWKSGSYDQTALLRGWMPPHPTFYVRRSVYDRLGVFDTRYTIAADYDTVLRFLARADIHASYIPEVLVRMRTGGISNRSLKTIIRKLREDLLVIRRNQVGGFLTLLCKNFRKVNQLVIPFFKR